MCTKGRRENMVKVFLAENERQHVRFEVFTAMTMKKIVFWDVAPCGCGFNVSPKCRFKPEPHGAASQKTIFFERQHV
jgi:hypothetical protein